MADPFGDIADLVTVGDEVEVKKSVSKNEEASSAASQRKPMDLRRSISAVFPPEMQGKASKDFEERCKHEKRIAELEKELHATRERLYQLRFDSSSSKEEITLNVTNHIHEIAQLELAINKERKISLRSFAASLQLVQLDMDASKLLQPLLRRDPSLKNLDFQSALPNPTKKAPSRASTSDSHKYETFAADEDDYEEEVMPLMRTRSTHVLKDKPAQEKWQGLFRMFREWKHHKQVAEATEIASRPGNQAMVDAEISKLRAAIYSLRQRKRLNNSDKELLRIMTAKLKALHEL